MLRHVKMRVTMRMEDVVEYKRECAFAHRIILDVKKRFGNNFAKPYPMETI